MSRLPSYQRPGPFPIPTGTGTVRFERLTWDLSLAADPFAVGPSNSGGTATLTAWRRCAPCSVFLVSHVPMDLPARAAGLILGPVAGSPVPAATPPLTFDPVTVREIVLAEPVDVLGLSLPSPLAGDVLEVTAVYGIDARLHDRRVDVAALAGSAVVNTFAALPALKVSPYGFPGQNVSVADWDAAIVNIPAGNGAVLHPGGAGVHGFLVSASIAAGAGSYVTVRRSAAAVGTGLVLPANQAPIYIPGNAPVSAWNPTAVAANVSAVPIIGLA